MNLTYTLPQLLLFVERIFIQTGFSKENAALSARLLTNADLRGVDSHGVARLRGYVRLAQVGRLNPNPTFTWHQKLATSAALNADQSIGFLSAHAAMSKAIEMAENVGIGMVSVSNSNHFGIAGQYSLMAAEKGMIGLTMTNASPLVAPTNSIDKMLGTNPIAVAVPAGINRPFVLDMATTTAANGKLEILQRKNLEAPLGWIQTQEGADTQNAHELKDGGALRPLGSFTDMGSHKGYGLGAMVDIFSGVLSGANFGPWVPPFVAFLPLAAQSVGQGIGHFLGAIRVDGFMDQAEFESRMDVWMEAFRKANPVGDSEVLVPGDPEWKLEDERREKGIPLLPSVVEDLNSLAKECQVPLFTETHLQ